MNIRTMIMLALLCVAWLTSYTQITDAERDSLYIDYIEDHINPDKVLHAEPL